jgi:serine/threonine protein kinase
MSPEYAMEGIFSVKSDIYSFGILVLEIVSGLKISSPHHLVMDFLNLVSCVSVTLPYYEMLQLLEIQPEIWY